MKWVKTLVLIIVTLASASVLVVAVSAALSMAALCLIALLTAYVVSPEDVKAVYQALSGKIDAWLKILSDMTASDGRGDSRGRCLCSGSIATHGGARGLSEPGRNGHNSGPSEKGRKGIFQDNEKGQGRDSSFLGPPCLRKSLSIGRPEKSQARQR